ncbi:Cupredoxin [Apiospora marii]|uniref:Cupredoxin n=1 Tax=Apiospora marii TaxID=335849 RepID=A0ABR1S979_9PEZI
MAITTWLLCLTTLAVVSQGARIRVDVGSNGAPALVYTPKVVTAQVGDIVDFHFVDENAASSVVRGVAGAPCTPFTPTKKGFFNSGFVLGDPTGINETTPIPIYCSVGGHCRAGMIGYINPGQGDFEAYASATAKLTQNQPPPMVPQTGGVFQQGVDGGYIMITFVNGGPGGGGGSSGGSAGDPLASAADALLGAPGGSKGSKGPRRAN